MRDSPKPIRLSAIQTLIRVSTKPVRRALLATLFLSLVLVDISCQHIGPKTIEDDRFAYNKALLNSWKQQTLLNIVRIRYDDLVSFVDVASVAQTHSLTGTAGASLGASIFPWDKTSNTLGPSLSGSRQATDSPVISYTPLTGAEFTRNLNSPIKPVEICNLIESGYSADALLNLTLSSINDINSVKRDVNLVNKPDRIARSTEFTELTQAIECAHGYGDINFYIQPGTDSDPAKVFMVIKDKDCGKKDRWCKSHPVAFVREKLELEPLTTQFEIVAGPNRMKDAEIAVQTRSAIAAMKWLSDYVQVPEAHINAGFARRKYADVQNSPITVQWSVKEPRGVFAAVPYEGYWFWIPENDVKSKFSLIYLRTLLALADTTAKPSPPVLTIPTR